jgi:hemoglobin-like flavoprotein
MKQKNPVVDAFAALPPYHQTGGQAKALNMSVLAVADVIVVPERMKKVIAIAANL